MIDRSVICGFRLPPGFPAITYRQTGASMWTKLHDRRACWAGGKTRFVGRTCLAGKRPSALHLPSRPDLQRDVHPLSARRSSHGRTSSYP